MRLRDRPNSQKYFSFSARDEFFDSVKNIMPEKVNCGEISINNDFTKVVHNGAYVYYIELTDNQGETSTYIGHFVLLIDY